VNVFTMQLLCADSGPWSTMSRACPPLSAKTTSGTTCPSHQESTWKSAEAWRRKGYFGHCCREMLEYVLKTSTNGVLSVLS